MFRSFVYPLIVLLLVSCGAENNESIEDTLESNDILSVTDSLLLIVDDEFESIKEENRLHEEEFHNLEDRVVEYRNILINDQRVQKELNNKIQVLITENKIKDSTISSLNNIITSNNYRIEKLEEKIYYNNIRFKEQTDLYESYIFRLEDSIQISNEKIEFLLEFISEGTRPLKGFRGEEYDYLYSQGTRHTPQLGYYPIRFEIDSLQSED